MAKERTMRVALGFILGVAVTVGGVFIYDTTQPFAANPIVNWSNAVERKDYLVEYFAARFDRLLKWSTFRY